MLLTRVTHCWYFPMVADVYKRFIGRDCFHTHWCCTEEPFHALWRHRSTSMFFECFILIFKQATTFRLNGYVYLCHLTNILCMYCDYFSSSSPKINFNIKSTPYCHEINVMAFDAECHEICFVGWKTNVMILISWDLENVMRFILSGTGARWNKYWNIRKELGVGWGNELMLTHGSPRNVEVIFQVYFSNSNRELISWANEYWYLEHLWNCSYVSATEPHSRQVQSTVDRGMAWCRQTTSHYLNQCWPSFPMPYGTFRPRWVKASQ